MAIYKRIKKRFYQDSLKLMRVSAEIKEIPDVDQAFAFMATEINKKTRIQEALMDDEVRHAGADDLVLLVECSNDALGESVLDEFEHKITSNSVTGRESGESQQSLPHTFEQGKTRINANIAVISVPGTYATVQAMLALNQKMNVMLFSDNVSIEDEVMLKDYAAKHDLLVMGPDCGTAIINGVPLCFANVVKRGVIGVVGASGTGTQELTVQLDAAGIGISQAIGTGGRDLSEEVAGRTTLYALELLRQDKDTEIVAIVSKPPSPKVAEQVTKAVMTLGKPAVLTFLGASSNKVSENIYIAGTIEEAVAKIIALTKKEDAENSKNIYERKAFEFNEWEKFLPSQRSVKGLYTGGTLASEAKFILKNLNADVIDLGDDEFTRGVLHPMIDPTIRNEYVLKAFLDDEVAIILCDVVLGFGSHESPAGELAKAVENSRTKTNSHKIVIASVIGTEKDPQIKSQQIEILENSGIYVFPSNQYAAETAAALAQKLQGVSKT